MWFAISVIVFASAIGFNVLALWLTDWFWENQSGSPSWHRAEDELTADLAPGKRLLTFC